MSEEKKKSVISLNENRVRIIGRVQKKAKEHPSGEFVRVNILLPHGRRGDDTKWIPIVVDVPGDKFKSRVMEAAPGDYLRASCFLIPKKVDDDEGYKKEVLMLQVDTWDQVGVTKGHVSESEMEGDVLMAPVDNGICMNEVTILGRHIIPKKRREEGLKLFGKEELKFAFPKIVYNNPMEKDSDASSTWFDIGVFGRQAEIAVEYMKHMDQVYVRGEIQKRPADFSVKGVTPDVIKVSASPFGFQFVSTRGKGGDSTEPKGPNKDLYKDGGDAFDDDDLPF